MTNTVTRRCRHFDKVSAKGCLHAGVCRVRQAPMTIKDRRRATGVKPFGVAW